MNNLYNFINEKLNAGILLKDVIENIYSYFDSKTINYCISKAKYISGNYNKIKLHEYSNDLFEMILICWDTNSETKIHDHPENGCVLYLMEGKLEEYLYNKELSLSKMTTFNSRNISYMENSFGYHKIKCVDKSISLHIYSPPNYIMRIVG